MVTVTVDQAELKMEVDTGASASIVSETTHHKLWGAKSLTLQKTEVNLHTYTGENLKICGRISVDVTYNG